MPNKILIVEDHAPQRLVLQKLLRQAGMEVVGVENLGEARRRIASETPDVVLLDLQLPDGSGIELLGELKASLPHGDVIVMTGMNDLSVAVEAMQSGAYDFLAKPFDRETILDVVHRCLQDQAARSEVGRGPDTSHDRSPRKLVGSDPKMLEVFKLMGMAATSRSPVLIRGASGTGKELVARSIHEHQMPDRPFLAVNCAALPDGLLESELFGHERGAFTGASTSRKGSLELAGDGTLLLDEIGDTSPSFQTKLLRVIQEQEFTPLGSERTRPLRARVMAATHRSLEEMIGSEEFRSDLYFRLRVIEITVPTLAERRQDIPRIALHLLEVAASRLDKPVHHIPRDVMRALIDHPWRGNVRELENTMTRAVALAKGAAITLEGLGLVDRAFSAIRRDAVRGDYGKGQVVESPDPSEGGPVVEDLDEVVRMHVVRVLERAEGNKREAARRLGISPARLYRILSDAD